MNNTKQKPAAILIVEDEYIVANDLKMMLMKAGRRICGIAQSYDEAMMLIREKEPEWVLLDIFLKGEKNGIDIAKELSKTDIGLGILRRVTMSFRGKRSMYLAGGRVQQMLF